MLETLHLNITRKFLIYLNLLLFFLLLIPCLLLFKYLENIFFQQIKKQALTVYQQIIITRKWIADHGGIYVEKLPWVIENPYLKLVGEKTKLFTSDGKVLIKNNPAVVTRQLSELAKENNLYWFKLTSLKYLNPFNKPDETEKKALLLFEKKTSIDEFGTIEMINKHQYYRLIKPIRTDSSCLKCHATQGYKLGDIRGAISIFIPLDDTLIQISYYKKLFLLAFAIFWICLNFTIIFITNRFIFNPLYCIIKLLKNLRSLYGGSIKETQKKDKFIKNEWQIILDSINLFLKEINAYQENMETKIKEITKNLEVKNQILENLLEKRKFLITNMAHEIKTPLTCIKGSIEYLSHYLKSKEAAEKLDYEKLKEFLEISRNNLKRLIQLFNMLIDLEKYEANLLDLEITNFNLKELIESTIYSLKGMSYEKDILFEVNLKGNLMLRGDREKISIVLTNLLNNAIKYSPQGGTIRVIAFEEDDYIKVEIEDEGIGIPKEKAERIFEKFYKEDSKGSGLGLTISKAYVEAHGGKIRVIPKERGGHLCFEIPKNLDKIKER